MELFLHHRNSSSHMHCLMPALCHDWQGVLASESWREALRPSRKRWIPEWSKTGMEDTQEDPLAVHCFCVCSGSALLGDLLGVSRSMEHDLLSSVLFIYPRIFLRVFIMYRLLVGFLFGLLYYYYYYYKRIWLWWRNVRGLQGHLTNEIVRRESQRDK